MEMKSRVNFFTKVEDPDATLSWSERISYAIGNYGLAWINGIMSAFFMLYLTNVAVIDAGIAGTLIAVSKLFDGVSDLIMGRIVEKTHSKFGKARIWLLRMCVPMAISTLLLFMIPKGASNLVKYVYMFIFYNLVNSVFYTSMFVPYVSMNYLMTNNSYERGLLGNLNMIGQVISNICLNTFFIKMLIHFGKGNQFSAEGWRTTMIVIGIIVIISSVICFFGTKERVAQDHPGEAKKEKEGSTKETVKALFSNKYWIMMTICMFFIFFVIVMYSVSAAYYAQFVLGDLNNFTPIQNALSIAQFVIMFATPFFMKKFGKHRTYQVGLAVMVIGFAGTGLAGRNIPMLIVFNVLKGFGLGAAGGMAFGMVSDTIDYGLWKTGIRTEGTGNAGISAAQKLGLGLGQAFMGWLLAAAGFNGAAKVQTASAQAAISFCYNWIPAILVGLCFIVMLFYKLDEEMPAIRKELDQKEGQK